MNAQIKEAAWQGGPREAETFPLYPDDFDSEAMAAATRAKARARAEVELLAAVADAPRQAWPILRDEGITLDSFSEPDTRAIFSVLELASYPADPPVDHQTTARRCRDVLITFGLWDADDLRPFATGCRWGPGPLGALLIRVPFDPHLTRAACRRLCAARSATPNGGPSCK